jgi:fatty-acyl-CoA synthase
LITPTRSGIPRKTDFDTLAAALDYAAEAATGFTFYSSRGEPLQALNYAEMRDLVEARARRLAGLGLATGDRVAMIGETTPDFVITFLAASAPGRARASSRRRRLRRAGAILRPDRAPARRLRRAPLPATRRSLAPSRRQRGRRAELVGTRRRAGGARAAGGAPARRSLLSPVFLGQHALPARVAVTHRALMRNCGDIAGAAIGAEPDDRIVSWLPLYHDMGLVGTCSRRSPPRPPSTSSPPTPSRGARWSGSS